MENANQVKLSTSSIKSYGRIFKINYEDVFNKNNKTSQDKLTMKVTINDKNVILNKKDLDVYHLECLEILSLENWNKCFRVNTNREIVEISYPYFGEICCDIQKAFKGNLNFTGENFTNSPLIPGDLETYYFQYISQQLFGTHLAFYGIQNLPEIKKKISNIPKDFISLLQKPIILRLLYNIFKQNKEKDDNNDDEEENFFNTKKLFKKGDVIEFSILLRKPDLQLTCSESLEKKTDKNHFKNKLKIKNSIWNIYFILL
tara:strand:+ start:2163 stop:2939 length:777 start_codon:yes stop_codon:yes gene_type:complete